MANQESLTSDFVAVRRTRLRRRILVAAGAIVVAVGLVVSALANSGGVSSVPLTSVASGQPRASTTTVIVHVVGAVLHPGLFTLNGGARVVDAVMRAGGLASAADECAVNLARPVVDGEQIVVPAKHDKTAACVMTGSTPVGASGSTKVSLTRATVGELDALPGIGPALAQRIIDWRATHGGFTSVKQLDDVSGIGPALLSQLTPLVTL